MRLASKLGGKSLTLQENGLARRRGAKPIPIDEVKASMTKGEMRKLRRELSAAGRRDLVLSSL